MLSLVNCTTTNLALGKHTSEISYYETCRSIMAVDGDTNTHIGKSQLVTIINLKYVLLIINKVITIILDFNKNEILYFNMYMRMQERYSNK